MKKPVIVVMGATGNIGQKLVKNLLERGASVRALGREVTKLQGLQKIGAETLQVDVVDANSLTKVFAGADSVFSFIPPHYGAEDFTGYQNRVGEAIAQALTVTKVQRVVNLSSVGAHLATDTGPINGLRLHEERLNKLTLKSLTHLRPSYFMENVLFGLGLIKNDGIYGSPLLPQQKFAQVATDDIATRAADLLLDLTHQGRRVVELLGPEDLSPEQMADRISALMGKKIPYVQFPYEAAERAMIGSGMSASASRAMIGLYRALNEKELVPEFGRTQAATTKTSFDTFLQTIALLLK